MKESVNKAIEETLAAVGKKEGYYFVGEFTTLDVLIKLGRNVDRINHDRILYVIRRFYPHCSFEEYSEDVGFVVHGKIRTN